MVPGQRGAINPNTKLLFTLLHMRAVFGEKIDYSFFGTYFLYLQGVT